MHKYTKLEIEIINLEEVDAITTSVTTEETDTHETLITKGNMVENYNSVGLFR